MQKADQLRTEIATISEMLKTGRADRALKRAVKAGKKWPKMPAFPQMAGLACIHQGDFKQAQTHLERAWKMEPENPDLIQNFGLSLVQGGDAGKALTLMNKVAAKAPLTPPQRYVRAMALLQERQLSEALEDVDEVLRHQNGNLQAHCLKADILDEMHQWNQAIDVLLAVAEKHPKFHYGQLRLAKGLVGLGRMSEALTHGRAAFALAPEDPETLEFAATLPNLSAEDRAELQALTSKLLEAGNANREAAATVHFAAASLAKQEGDTATEMLQLRKAHDQLQHGFKSWETRAEKACRQRLSTPLPDPASAPRTDIPRPVFVVGLPRSGTTLIERILASHSAVQGLGELAGVHHWARKAESQSSAGSDVQELADYYADNLPQTAEGTRAFVDKAPGNYAFLGAIAQAFPNAVILNVTRDPRDVALSMWRTHFGAGGLYYTHDLSWMAAEANRYRRYIQHWHAVLPGRVHDISYEHLVNNLEDGAKELAQLCDLPFEQAMLSPDKSSDAIKTASNLQARRPVNTASVGGWQAVADYFAPFVKGLDADLWPEIHK